MYTGPFTVSGLGSHSIYYFSVDRAGNYGIEYWSPQTIAISDQTAPTTTATVTHFPSCPAGYVSGGDYATVTLTATDNPGGTGVQNIIYSATGAGAFAQQTASGSQVTIFIMTGGSTTITYHATDNAGNAETAKRTGPIIVGGCTRLA